MNDDLHCPDRIQDEIIIHTEADASFWREHLAPPLPSGDMSHAMSEALQKARNLGMTGHSIVERSVLAGVIGPSAQEELRLHLETEGDRLDDHPVEDEPVLAIQARFDAAMNRVQEELTPHPGHEAHVTIGACRPTAPCPACQQRLEEKAVLPVDLTKEAPRTLRQILFTHRALGAASALEITELMAELEPLFRAVDGD